MLWNENECGETKLMRILRQPIPVKLKIDQKQLGTVEFFFKYVDNMLANDGRCTSEIKSGITIAKAASNKQSALFTTKMDLELGKKLAKCYIFWPSELFYLACRNGKMIYFHVV
jgi:hypothetical protein